MERVTKPLLIYDADCRFCRLWIDRWRALAGDRIDLAPSQEIARRFPDIPAARFRRSVQLVTPAGDVLEGAKAVFTALSHVPGRGWLLWAYRHLPLFAPLTEAGYRFISKRRAFAYKMTRLLWGRDVLPPEFILSRWVFLRGVGIIFLTAFLSYFVQLGGIIGSQGILPATALLEAADRAYGPAAPWYVPTLAWLGASDGALHGLALAGIAASAMVIVGAAVLPALAACYVLYLSLVHVGQVFLGYQWDALVLEIGFLALFFAPTGLLPSIRKEGRPSAVVRWLFWILFFRFAFNNGLVKLLSGDETWRNLTALAYHYFTQPLPNPLSWYMHHLPLWYHKFEVLATFVIEFGAAVLVFAPRRARFAGALAWIALQLMLIATGNYAGYNLQAIVLALLLFDDAFYRRFFPRRMVEDAAAPRPPARRTPAWLAKAALLGAMALASGLVVVSLFIGRGSLPLAANAFFRLIAPFHVINTYGAFAVMTTTRPEVVIEGSDNGLTWKEYELPFKPGDPMRMPPVVAPHHPRLDWQMWFLQFSDWRGNPWFVNLMARLLMGSPDVLALFERNPFPASPPRYVRALRYDYRFTTPEERAATGAWWVRELKGQYFPTVTREDFLQVLQAEAERLRRGDTTP